MKKLFMAIMYATDDLFDKAKNDLVEQYGDVRAESSAYEFDFTHYYDKEMGAGLKKKFLVFEKDVSKEDMTDVKFFITEIEEKYADSGNRKVNIDPGYLSPTELVLATWKGKDFKEQISEKVWVHKVLEFDNLKVKEFFHTFADYKVKENQKFIVENKSL